MAEYNPYQQIHYKLKYSTKPKAPGYKGKWDLHYMGQFIVKNASYAICKKAKQELEKNKFTIKSLIVFEHAK